MSAPFDHRLHDAVMNDTGMAKPQSVMWNNGFAAGVHAAATEAAQIAAERPDVPEIPEGWRLDALQQHGARYVAVLKRTGFNEAAFGYGVKWHEALAAAIAEVQS